MILAGDIGGTKCLLALFSPDRGPRRPLQERSLPSRDYPGLSEVVADYLRGVREPVRFACFGVPGPVVGEEVETPNLPWVVSLPGVRKVLGVKVTFLNDLEATGYGVGTLTAEEFRTLAEGRPNPRGNAAIIAPGTGLGEVILFWDGHRHRPSASEGGHADFAPRTPMEADLLRFLWRELPRVSFDRIVSGSGLCRVYAFFKAGSGLEEQAWLARELAEAPDPAVVISQAALSGRSELCAKALDLWVQVCGAEAGNLALKALATAGLYVGGGIAPKILGKLTDGSFLQAFRDKGRLSGLMEQIPVRVILNDRAALYGAAHYALDLEKQG